MSDPYSSSQPIKFPVPKPAAAAPKLALPRRPRRTVTRSPFEIADATAAARESIKALVSATRAPFAPGGAEATHMVELERTLRQLELTLQERERLITESEARLADRERDLAEAEALLIAREQLAAVSRKGPAETEPGLGVSPEERDALQKLRAEIERQEASLEEAKQALREREQFLDESEAKLFEKVQAQQEKEIEQEQREEDLKARERRIREREAAVDPQAAAALKADDDKAKQRDEFNE